MADEPTPDPVVEAIVQSLRDRSRKGLAKYGVGLDRKDLSAVQWLKHLQEELLDGALYVEALMGMTYYHDDRESK